MSGSKLSGGGAMPGSRASACFLCQKEIQSRAGTGTKYHLDGCEGLSQFLLNQGLLSSRPLVGGGEEVCRVCLPDLWELEELINKEREIRDQMYQTANVIKSRVQPNDQSAAGSEEEKKAGHDGDSVGEDQRPATDSEEDDLLEVFSILSEDEDAIKQEVVPKNEAGYQESGADKRSEAPSEHDHPKNPLPKPSSLDSEEDEDANAVEAVAPSSESEEEQEQPSDDDMDEDFEAPSVEDDDEIQALFTHQSKRPFRCEVTGCESRFRNRQHLYNHRHYVHSGKAVKTCDLCGKRLASAQGLKIHRVLHFKKGKFPCNREGCCAVSSSAEGLKKHVRLHHPS